MKKTTQFTQEQDAVVSHQYAKLISRIWWPKILGGILWALSKPFKYWFSFFITKPRDRLERMDPK